MDLHKNNKPKKPCALSCHSSHPLSTPCTMLVNTPKMGDNDTEAFARPHHPNMARNVKYACEVNQDRSVICCWLTCFSKNWKQNAPPEPPKTNKQKKRMSATVSTGQEAAERVEEEKEEGRPPSFQPIQVAIMCFVTMETPHPELHL